MCVGGDARPGRCRPGRLHQLLQREQRVLVEVVDAVGLVGTSSACCALRILRRHAGRAVAGVAGLRLDAAEREHEAARRVAPVGAEREHARDVEGADDLAGAAELDAARAGSRPTSVLCTSSRPSCSGAPTWSVNSSGAAPVPPSAPSTTMKSGVMPVSSIALAMPNHSHGWPMQSLKPVGLPPDSSRSRSMNCSISIGVVKAPWRRRRDAVDATAARRAPRRSRASPSAPAARRRGRAWRPATA